MKKIYRRKYYKSYSNKIFNDKEYDIFEANNSLPKDTSALYIILKGIIPRGSYFSSIDLNLDVYKTSFDLISLLGDENNLTSKILNMFDCHIQDIKITKDDRYEIKYENDDKKKMLIKTNYTVCYQVEHQKNLNYMMLLQHY